MFLFIIIFFYSVPTFRNLSEEVLIKISDVLEEVFCTFSLHYILFFQFVLIEITVFFLPYSTFEVLYYLIWNLELSLLIAFIVKINSSFFN